MVKKITIKYVERIIDAWEDVSDINQHRDVPSRKELVALYKKVVEIIENG